jgi:hypothetical protein
MAKIIYRGKNPNIPKRYRGSCPACGCVFEVEESETFLHGAFDQNKKADCPETFGDKKCGTIVKVDLLSKDGYSDREMDYFEGNRG